MGSNLTFQSRNVLSKKLMSGDAKKGLDNINLFSIITIMSFFLLAPFTLFVEGFKLTPAVMAGMNLDFALIMRRLCIAAFCFHAYQQVCISPCGLEQGAQHFALDAWNAGILR